MKVLLLSDLHTEWGNVSIYPEGLDWDVVVLAGDIGGHRHVIPWCIDTFGTEKPIVFAPGNHEYYGDTFEHGRNVMKTYASAWSNFHFLDNDSVIIDGVQFIGSTLWSDFRSSSSQLVNHKAMVAYDMVCDDATKIKNWSSSDALHEHADSLEFLYQEIRNFGNIPKRVVVTHHAPDALCANPIYSQDELASSFHSHAFKTLSERVKKKGFNSLKDLGKMIRV